MAIVDEAGEDAAKAFWPSVTDAHIKAGRAWQAAVPQPVDRERVAELLSNATRDLDYKQWETPHGMLPFADALIAAGLFGSPPQPVDREALLMVLTKWDVGGWKYEDAEGYRERVCNSLLAVLAVVGEQEQVEP